MRNPVFKSSLIAFFIVPYLAFATSLGEIVVAHPLYGMHKVVYEKQNDFAVVEGDIIIGRIARLNARNAIFKLPLINGSSWPNNTVPYEISKAFSAERKTAIFDAIELLEEKTNVHFVRRNVKNADHYPNYILFSSVEGTSCSSSVGMEGGQQMIILSPRCQKMGIVHEICHALGLWHEQSRLDRDNYVKIIIENIEPEHLYNFNQHFTDGKDYGEYDYESIMHYNAYAFSKNGKKTIIPIPREDQAIGLRSRLSPKDIAAINFMYPDIGKCKSAGC